MFQRNFELHALINAPVKRVYEHLANPRNLLGLQPLLIAMSPIEQATNEAGQIVLQYDTVEAFRFWGWIVYRNRIRVRCVLTDPNVRMDNYVQSPGNVHLHFTHWFDAEGTGTRLTLKVVFEAPMLLTRFVREEARRVQREVFGNLKARLELPQVWEASQPLQ